MPTYEYTCRDCGHTFDIWQSMSDDPLTVCPECGGALRKVFAAPAISFKGSGFYATDQREKAKKTTEDGEGKRRKEDGEPKRSKEDGGEPKKDTSSTEPAASSSASSKSPSSASSNSKPTEKTSSASKKDDSS